MVARRISTFSIKIHPDLLWLLSDSDCKGSIPLKCVKMLLNNRCKLEHTYTGEYFEINGTPHLHSLVTTTISLLSFSKMHA